MMIVLLCVLCALWCVCVLCFDEMCEGKVRGNAQIRTMCRACTVRTCTSIRSNNLCVGPLEYM